MSRSGKRAAKRKSCLDKVAYPTANAAARRAGLRALRGGDKLSIYKCIYAEHWHIAKWKPNRS